MTTYWRVHWKHSPPFGRENAWSYAYNEEYEGDTVNCPTCKSEGEVDCPACGGDGAIWVGPRGDKRPLVCPTCGGRRKVQCGTCEGRGIVSDRVRRGYSAFTTPRSLVRYIDATLNAKADDPVVVFSGSQIGIGHDGEPLVMPDMVNVRWTSYGALKLSLAR